MQRHLKESRAERKGSRLDMARAIHERGEHTREWRIEKRQHRSRVDKPCGL